VPSVEGLNGRRPLVVPDLNHGTTCRKDLVFVTMIAVKKQVLARVSSLRFVVLEKAEVARISFGLKLLFEAVY